MQKKKNNQSIDEVLAKRRFFGDGDTKNMNRKKINKMIVLSFISTTISL